MTKAKHRTVYAPGVYGKIEVLEVLEETARNGAGHKHRVRFLVCGCEAVLAASGVAYRVAYVSHGMCRKCVCKNRKARPRIGVEAQRRLAERNEYKSNTEALRIMARASWESRKC